MLHWIQDLMCGTNVEASKTQTDHASGSKFKLQVRLWTLRLGLIIQNQNFIFLKNYGHLARNLHYILKHLEFSEAVVQEGVAETTILEYSGPVTVFRIFALSTHVDR